MGYLTVRKILLAVPTREVLVVEVRYEVKQSTVTTDPSKQRIIRARMSIMPKLGNYGLV